MDQRPEDTNPYLNDGLAAFPYVNGGLFSDENIEVPRITDEIFTPLINEANRIENCFSKENGWETSSNTWYLAFEKRYQRLIAYKGLLFDEDWVDYDYWEFTKCMMRGARPGVSMDLQSAILYSNAFADDNDDGYIVTDTAMAAEVIKSEKETVLFF